MNLSLIIILCVLIAIVLIALPLIVSRKAELQSKKTELTIKPTEFDNVFLLTYSYGEWYVTPKEKVSEFDIVVNHCPTMKIVEFNGFDEK